LQLNEKFFFLGFFVVENRYVRIRYRSRTWKYFKRNCSRLINRQKSSCFIVNSFLIDIYFSIKNVFIQLKSKTIFKTKQNKEISRKYFPLLNFLIEESSKKKEKKEMINQTNKQKKRSRAHPYSSLYREKHPERERERDRKEDS